MNTKEDKMVLYKTIAIKFEPLIIRNVDFTPASIDYAIGIITANSIRTTGTLFSDYSLDLRSAITNRRLEIYNTKDVGPKKKCGVCWEDKVLVAIVECGHMHFCRECLSQVTECPMCRTKFNSVLRIYQ